MHENQSSDAGKQTNKALRVLVVDNDPGDRVLLSAYLEKPPGTYGVSYATTLKDAIDKAKEKSLDIVLLDLGLNDSQGIDTFLQFKDAVSYIPVIVVTGLDDKAVALEAVKYGAQDYLIKGLTGSEVLSRSLHFAVERHAIVTGREKERVERENRREVQVYRHLCSAAAKSGVEPTKSWRHSNPEAFRSLVSEYARSIAFAPEIDKKATEINISNKLLQIAQTLAHGSAHPQEVMEMHQSAVFTAASGKSEDETKMLTESSRFLLLELLGHLAHFYRQKSGLS